VAPDHVHAGTRRADNHFGVPKGLDEVAGGFARGPLVAGVVGRLATASLAQGDTESQPQVVKDRHNGLTHLGKYAIDQALGKKGDFRKSGHGVFLGLDRIDG
jgi:hypothetical protein